MRSTFKVLFYVKKGSEKPNGNLDDMGNKEYSVELNLTKSGTKKFAIGKKLENSINLMFNMLSNEIIEFAPNFVNTDTGTYGALEKNRF